MSGKRVRRLSEDEHALWREVTRSVARLRKAKAPAAPVPTAEPVDREAPRPKLPRLRAAPVASPEKPAIRPPPALAPLEKKFRRKLVRGVEPLEARIDLHGMTQSEAHAALDRFLHRAQADGIKTVLVITGKGVRGQGSVEQRWRGDGSERGVLRRQVPLWLHSPEMRHVVLGFEDAHIGHGGEGALYVRIRRLRGNIA